MYHRFFNKNCLLRMPVEILVDLYSWRIVWHFVEYLAFLQAKNWSTRAWSFDFREEGYIHLSRASPFYIRILHHVHENIRYRVWIVVWIKRRIYIWTNVFFSDFCLFFGWSFFLKIWVRLCVLYVCTFFRRSLEHFYNWCCSSEKDSHDDKLEKLYILKTLTIDRRMRISDGKVTL